MRSTISTAAMLATLLSLVVLSSAHDDNSTQYTLTDDLSYKNFFSAFDFFDGPDPTQGFVQYQNQTSAVDKNLVGYLEDTQSVFMGVDYTTKDPAGRASVRLESKKSWNQGLYLPANWLLSSSAAWPQGSEIDFLEGVNDYDSNTVTLHTTKGCMVDNSTSSSSGSGMSDHLNLPFSGTMATGDCDIAPPNQDKKVGCSIHAPKALFVTTQTGSGGTATAQDFAYPSYGTDFNKAGGGVYTMEWTSTSISFTKHFDSNISTTTTSPDPSIWSTPMARFDGADCDFTERFENLKIIFNTAFCGEWAGKEWDKSCAKKTGVSTCEAYVCDNPAAFTEAYWEAAGLKWFQKVICIYDFIF
ncbi:hypothetical protein EJ02DRAFT_440928 [Clathrospora elynae]|uniref:GH16 domain-containing protein n=1 Tax=Clathrospora elynae TaxID=706981 RepID=A0A6A5T1Z4_9PLEO|nr:hypothetical protein EJ02DRAFT_440928 [Clathrospora elynae]